MESVIPARLAFLALYNPSLRPSSSGGGDSDHDENDDALKEQIVYSYSRRSRSRARRQRQQRRPNDAEKGAQPAARGRSGANADNGNDDDGDNEDRHEATRRIGLAQGMVEFAKYVFFVLAQLGWVFHDAVFLFILAGKKEDGIEMARRREAKLSLLRASGFRTFSNGEAVDSIETDRQRIVLHELEPGWWIYAV